MLLRFFWCPPSRPSSTAWRRTRPLLIAVLWISGLGALGIGARASHAEHAMPLSAEWLDAVEDTFFAADGELSLVKLAAYRERLEQRHRELQTLLTAHYRARGRSKRETESRLKHKRELANYARIVGRDQDLGLLDLLWDQADPSAARLLAATILDLDRALLLDQVRHEPLAPLSSLGLGASRRWVVEAPPGPEDAAREASNLWNPETGLFYESADLARAIDAGADLSLLGPAPGSPIWQAPESIAAVDVRRAAKSGAANAGTLHAGLGVSFPERRAPLSVMRRTPGRPGFALGVSGAKGRSFFTLTVAGSVHSEPTANALLATLGFQGPLLRRVSQFRVDLGDTAVEDVRAEWRAYFALHRTHLRERFDDFFVSDRDEEGAYLIARQATLEARPKSVIRVGPWAFGQNGHDGLREVRGFAVFSAWIGHSDLGEADHNLLALRLRGAGRTKLYKVHEDTAHAFGTTAAEQLNAFPWTLARRMRSGRVELDFHTLRPHALQSRITYADARWMVRQIGQLTRRQIVDAIAIGQWPRSVARLLAEKLIARRNQLVRCFDLIGESTPSGPLTELRFERELTTPDGAVSGGTLVEGRFGGSPDDFANTWEERLAPVWERAVLLASQTLQTEVGRPTEVVFDARSVGAPALLTSELLVQVQRQVEENPAPSGPRDPFLTRDTVVLGARLGGGFVGRGEAAYYRRYTLVTPAASRRDAHRDGEAGALLRWLLPLAAQRGSLPEDYVLQRESYLEARARAITDDASGGSAPAGAELSFGRLQIDRNIVSVRGDDVHVYRDTSLFGRAAYRAFLKFVFVRLPLLGGHVDRGRRSGELYSLGEAFAGEPSQARATLDDFLRSGDPEGLDALASRIELSGDFDRTRHWLELPPLLRHAWSRVSDDITLRDPQAEDATPLRFEQHHETSRHARSWFGRERSYEAQVSGSVAAPDAPSPRLREPIVIRFSEHRSQTTSAELAALLRFASELGLAGGSEEEAAEPAAEPEGGLAQAGPSEATAQIPFTPALHAADDAWGPIRSHVEVGFAPGALDALLRLEPEDYWQALAARLGIPDAELARHRARLRPTGHSLRARARHVPAPLRRTILRSKRLVDRLARAGRLRDEAARYEQLVRALALAAYRSSDGFDPLIAATLRDLAGASQVSVEGWVRQPGWLDQRLVAGANFYLQTHAEPHAASRSRFDLVPETAAALYGLLPDLAATAAALHPPPEDAPAVP